MTRSNVFLSLWLVLIAGVVPRNARAINVNDFIDFSLRDAGGNILLPGRLYVPPEASVNPTTGPRPMMVFLHGSGANGTDNLVQLTQVTDRMFTEARDRGAFLYVPQATSTWSSLARR